MRWFALTVAIAAAVAAACPGGAVAGWRIVASGGAELAKQLEAEGYEAFIPAGVGGESA